MEETPVYHTPTSTIDNQNKQIFEAEAKDGPSSGEVDLFEKSVDESTRLRDLQAEVRDQDDLERDIGREADKLLVEQANERDKQRLEKTRASKEKLQVQIRKLGERISEPIGTTQRARLKNDVDRYQTQVEDLENDIHDIQERMNQRAQDAEKLTRNEALTSGRLASETQRDYLIRTGKITPFSNFGLSSHGQSSSNLEGALFDAEEEHETGDLEQYENNNQMSHRNLRQPGFARREDRHSSDSEYLEPERPRKRRKLPRQVDEVDAEHDPQTSRISEDSAYEQGTNSVNEDECSNRGGESDSGFMPSTEPCRKRANRRSATGLDEEEEFEDLRGLDDGKEAVYQSRLRKWSQKRSAARRRAEKKRASDDNKDVLKDEQQPAIDDFAQGNIESHLPHPELPDTDLGGGYKIPGDIYPSLFDYQKTGVQWLWELYTQQVGGIVGDEMGLGKTIQIISFLAGLHYSSKLWKPIIVVCPATVMKQWVNEFHRWWPPFRVTILHSSGSGMVNVRKESSREDELTDQMWDPNKKHQPLTTGQKRAKNVVKPILDQGGVLVTTYSGLQTYAPLLIPVDWEYAILDEGHKIRNPNAAITIYCKELRTANRIILSGTPMQNNLIELWSLFDFVFPMRLGTLVNFRTQFEIPIRQGGYASASNLQVQTAFKCAETLKDAISPYLLQRFKVDVAADLPKKSEQVLFCRLTKLQRDQYKHFLASNDMDSIMAGKRQVLFGVDILRKICNHPDLQDHKNLSIKSGYDYGNPARSGKMQVVGSLLELWKETGHKTLLFAQHRIMLDILEKYIKSMQGFKYRRMDGNTPIQARQSMVDEFNTNEDLHVFLLTTKVGGLGINLTGADRVIIYDPDWNPSTDLQARERAWRLGQKREVTIYRLMTAGTIEEKIYHRQIFKQFLTNKILRDPKQRQTFHLNDLHDLFSLNDGQGPTETSTLFKDAEVKYSSEKPKTSSSANGGGGQSDQPTKGVEDVGKINGVNSIEEFEGPTQEQRNPDADGKNSESRVMESIFARSGIHSAVEHEQIVGNKRKLTADPEMIEHEARKVASEAAQELRKAGEVARTVPVGTPTWTGQFGIAGRPQENTPQRAFATVRRNRGGGMSSSSLLAGLYTRPGVSESSTPRTASPIGSAGSRPESPNPPRGKDFGRLIRDYLSSHGGSVYTQMLIDHFNRFCTTPQATLEFKETLKIIALLEKGSRGRGKWVLKPEYVRDV